VQRLLEDRGAAADVPDRELHPERSRDGDGHRQREPVGEAAPRRRFRRELEDRPQGSAGLARHRSDGPGEDPGVAVRRRVRRAGLRPEPGEADGHPAADRLPPLEVARRAHPEDGLFVLRLEVGDVRSLEIDEGVALGRVQRQPVESSRPLLEARAVGVRIHGGSVVDPRMGGGRNVTKPSSFRARDRDLSCNLGRDGTALDVFANLAVDLPAGPLRRAVARLWQRGACGDASPSSSPIPAKPSSELIDEVALSRLNGAET
jgi:hypothetical protein